MGDMEKNIQETNDKTLSMASLASPTILPWDKYSNWLHCACIVTFDLELGQAMEVITANK